MGERQRVFPTCVGVFLRVPDFDLLGASLPHMRGGVSHARMVSQHQEVSSPHAWGCFPVNTTFSKGSSVFPTCVGVFLFASLALAVPSSLPHMRGGVSLLPDTIGCSNASSPHAWGCFSFYSLISTNKLVFPTCVGVFLTAYLENPLEWSLPHMRGGVSNSF